MWQLKYAAAKDFMSFETAEFRFDEKCYVVRGSNLDNDGQQSNGGGKTSFVDIAPIALLGYSLTGRNVKNCVNWNTGAKSFTVELWMENVAHGMDCYITRTIYSGTKGQELSILVNNEVPPSLPSKKGVVNGVDVKEGNAYILKEILNITEDDLLNYYFISKKNYTPFLEVNTDRKLEVIGRFSRADVVDRVINGLTENVKEVERDIRVKEDEIVAAHGFIEALKQMLLEPAREQFEQNKLDSIAELHQQIYSLMEKDADLAESQNAEHDKLAATEGQLDNSFDQQIKDQQVEVDKIRAELNKHNQYASIKKGQLATLEANLKSAIECPKCKHKFTLTPDVVPTQGQIDELKSYITKDLVEKTAEIQTRINGAEASMKPLYAKRQEQNMIKIEIDTHNRKIKSLTDERQRLAKAIQQKEAEAQRVAAQEFEDQSDRIQQQLEQKENELQSIRLQLQELTEEITTIKKWIDQFYDFKFYLGNKPIESVCVLVNQYLALNGSDLNLFIEGFKKLRSGEIRQALTPVVYRNWMNPQPLDQFSEGEKVRLNLTVDLAFQQLINSSSKFGGLDYYQNDELLNPLDSLGVSLAAKAFNQLNKTILLVSHSGADMVYENTILIQKENKTSRLV